MVGWKGELRGKNGSYGATEGKIVGLKFVGQSVGGLNGRVGLLGLTFFLFVPQCHTNLEFFPQKCS